MRATAFIKSIALVATVIFSANAQTTELFGKLDLTLGDKVLDSRDWQARYDQLTPDMMDQRGDGQSAEAMIWRTAPTVSTHVSLKIDEEIVLHPVQPRGIEQSLSSYFKAQAYTHVLASYVAESLDHWQAFLQDNHIGFAFKGRTWAIGSLID